MNWDAIGAIGEVVGAAGVIGSEVEALVSGGKGSAALLCRLCLRRLLILK